MKTIINIGTNKKNIVGVEFDKPFKEITSKDIFKVVRTTYPGEPVQVHGWCDVTNKTN